MLILCETDDAANPIRRVESDIFIVQSIAECTFKSSHRALLYVGFYRLRHVQEEGLSE